MLSLTPSLKMFNQKGFTLVEVLVALGLFVVLSVLISSLGRDIFFHHYNISRSLVSESEAKLALSRLVSELRRAQTASTGSYPIGEAGTSTLTFYSDINNSGQPARLRYFLSGSDLKRGVTYATGEPYIYDDDSESLTTAVSQILATSTPIFSFFDSNYNGASSSLPLVEPVEIKNIRLVKINFFILPNFKLPDNYYNLTSQVMLRNLKDNF